MAVSRSKSSVRSASCLTVLWTQKNAAIRAPCVTGRTLWSGWIGSDAVAGARNLPDRVVHVIVGDTRLYTLMRLSLRLNESMSDLFSPSTGFRGRSHSRTCQTPPRD